MITDLFVNFSIVISLIFIYMQIRWKTHKQAAIPSLSVVIDGISAGCMGYVLMYFSIRITPETILDFRYIPIMLMVLFVGKRPAIIGSVIIIVGRFYIGVNRSAVYAIFMVGLLLIGYLILNELLKAEERMLRKGFYFTIYSNVIVTYFLVIMVGEFNRIVPVMFLFWIISTLGSMVAVYLVNYMRSSEYLFNKYQVESSTDFLTGLSNIRKFDDYWTKVSENAKKSQTACAIIMIDIDRFKLTNDTYGHAAGDFVLVELGRIMEEIFSNYGCVFRKGGEEFIVVLPDSDKGKALNLAEALRQHVEQKEFITRDLIRIPITVSIGVTAYPETINQLSDMVERADRLLYKSKNEGRNRVSV